MSKIFKIVLILTSIVWTIYSVFTVFFKSGTINLLPLIGLVPVFAALYSDVDWLYISINKFRSYLSAKTVSFSPKYQYSISDKVSSTTAKQNLDEVLSKLGYVKNTKRQKEYSDDLIHYDLINKSGLSFDLDLSLMDQEESMRIILKVNFQISYRDVRKTWEEFCQLQEMVFDGFARLQGSKPQYAIVIKTNTKSFNPFYRLTIRRLGKVEVNKFLLKFKDGHLMIETSQHKIYATSDLRTDIDKVIKDYVPLSKII